MLENFRIHIERHFEYLSSAKLLIACSGGLDSVVLTYLLHKMEYSMSLAHCNFNLRGSESDADAQFVEDLSKKLSISIYSESFDTKYHAKNNQLSTQMAARELRYNWFESILEQDQFDYVLTAHHADDDLETFFINLSRGTGLKGLQGIPSKNNKILRPLLPFSREEILDYAKTHKLYWREDSSNQKTDYLRNAIRHQVIPPLKETTKHLLSNFQKTQQYLKGSQALVDDYMVLLKNLLFKSTDNGYEIDIDQLNNTPNREAVIFELLRPFNFTAWDDIFQLLTAQSGKQVFSYTHRLLKDRNKLILSVKKDKKEAPEVFFIKKSTSQIAYPIELSLIPIDRMGYINSTTIYVNSDKLEFPLALRKWREGDVFQPFGMKGKKKLSKFFKDEKLSLAAKESIWILYSGHQIVWVVGHRADERFKVTTETKNILRISTK